jgi:hypothetical protein
MLKYIAATKKLIVRKIIKPGITLDALGVIFLGVPSMNESSSS